VLYHKLLKRAGVRLVGEAAGEEPVGLPRPAILRGRPPRACLARGAEWASTSGAGVRRAGRVLRASGSTVLTPIFDEALAW